MFLSDLSSAPNQEHDEATDGSSGTEDEIPGGGVREPTCECLDNLFTGALRCLVAEVQQNRAGNQQDDSDDLYIGHGDWLLLVTDFTKSY